jgi:hypothetical protein
MNFQLHILQSMAVCPIYCKPLEILETSIRTRLAESAKNRLKLTTLQCIVTVIRVH